MGHGDAELCLEKLKEVMEGLDYEKLLQVSMDGLHVNWKLLRLLEDERNSSSAPKLLNIGSCGLHVLHGAYEHGQKHSEWELDLFLKNCFSIFKQSPARRSDYLQANNLHASNDGRNTSYLFPLKSCGHRWLENSKSINRILEIFDKLKNYFSWLETQKKVPKDDNRFIRIKKFLSSQTTEAILNFSLTILNDVQPFLSFFQAERPLSVFCTRS